MKHTKELIDDMKDTMERVGGSSSFGDTYHVIQSNGKSVAENLTKEIEQFDKMYKALKDMLESYHDLEVSRIDVLQKLGESQHIIDEIEK